MDSIITRISVCYCHLCVDVVIIYLYLFAGQKGFCKIICRPLVLEGLLHETYNAVIDNSYNNIIRNCSACQPQDQISCQSHLTFFLQFQNVYSYHLFWWLLLMSMLSI